MYLEDDDDYVRATAVVQELLRQASATAIELHTKIRTELWCPVHIGYTATDDHGWRACPCIGARMGQNKQSL